MRRSSDVKKQENGDDERQAHEHQQDIQDQPVIRSTTVLLKQSAEKDQQGYKQEEKDSRVEPPESNAG